MADDVELKGLPTYIKAILAVGVTGTLALGFGWFLAARVDAKMDTMLEIQRAAAVSHQISDQIQIKHNAQILQFMLISCVRESTNQRQRDECAQALR